MNTLARQLQRKCHAEWDLILDQISQEIVQHCLETNKGKNERLESVGGGELFVFFYFG